MHRMRQDAFDESNRKRPAPSEPSDGLDPAKRQRLGAEALSDPPSSIPPLPPGPTSFAQLFTLTGDEGAKNFDVQAIPSELVVKILVPMLMRIDKGQMDNAINVREEPFRCKGHITVQYELLRCLRVVRYLIALIRHYVPLYLAVNICFTYSIRATPSQSHQ